MDSQAFDLLTRELDAIKDEIKSVKGDTKALLEFKGKILGWSAALSFIGSIAVTIITKIFF